MIPFFRRIRQRFLTNNKFSRYLLYALGEIVLVVIGILIALQINNWNSEQENLKLGSIYLSDIKNEIQTDLERIDIYIQMLNESIAKREKALQTENLHSLPLDSLSFILFSQNLDIKFSQLTFDKIKNLGLARLLKNDSLNDRINRYYNEQVVGLKQYADYHFEYHKKYLDYMTYDQPLIDNTDYIDQAWYPALYKNTAEEKDLQAGYIIEFLQSTKGKNIVFQNLMYDEVANNRLKKFLSEGLALMNLICDELEKNSGVAIDRTNLPDGYDLIEIKLPDAMLQKYIGRYLLKSKQILTISKQGAQLFLEIEGNIDNTSIYAYGEDKFFLEEPYVQIHFHLIADTVTSISIIQDGATYSAKKIK